MDIIGRGFVAQNLRSVSDKHSRALVYATGVATTTMSDPHAFNHDTELLYGAIRRCQRTGEQLVYLSTASAAMYGAVDRPCVEDADFAPEDDGGADDQAGAEKAWRPPADYGRQAHRLLRTSGPRSQRREGRAPRGRSRA